MADASKPSRWVSALTVLTLWLFGCADDSSGKGAVGAGNDAGSSAQSTAGGGSSPSLGGAPEQGGTLAGGFGQGGAITTGTTLGGASAGGAMGGRATSGGASQGGASAGGHSLGGASYGGTSYGGASLGGNSSGGGGQDGVGAAAGEGAEPGRGGASQGGMATGGSSGGAGDAGQGGAATGGSGGVSPGGAAGSQGDVLPGWHWAFDTLQDGHFAEQSGEGEAFTVQSADAGSGLIGQAVVLGGTNSAAATENPVVDTLGSYSISAWVRLDELSGFSTFVSQSGTRVSAFYLQLRDDLSFAFTTLPSDDTGVGSCVASGPMQPRIGEWYHLVGTRDAATGEQRLYRDGILVGRASCQGSFASTGALAIGRGLWDGAASDFFRGSVDELRVIDQVLTPSEIVTLYRQDRPEARNYLFAYFAEQAQGRGDGLRLAHSHDGLHWGAIGANRVFLPPEVGGKSFRDPHVMRAPDGNYHLVWTTSCVPWAESGCVQDRGFGHAASPNLVDWGKQSYVPVELEVEHVWAPETFYDEASQQFMVFWSSPLDNDPSASDPHSIYYMLTSEFVEFSKPNLLYAQPGQNFIDATITRQSDGYFMFLKDEANGQKNIRALASAELTGSSAWTSAPSNPLTGSYAAEGPSVLERDGQLFLYFDKYGEGAYGALRSDDLSALISPASWQDISDQVYFEGVRHGTPIDVPWEIYEVVAEKAGAEP